MKVRLNANGIFAVNSASLYERQQVTEDEQPGAEPMETDTVNATSAAGNNVAANGPGGDDSTQAETDVCYSGNSFRQLKRVCRIHEEVSFCKLISKNDLTIFSIG